MFAQSFDLPYSYERHRPGYRKEILIALNRSSLPVESQPDHPEYWHGILRYGTGL